MLLFLNAITHNNTDFTKEAVGNLTTYAKFLKQTNNSFLNYNEQRLPENIPRN